MRTTTFLSGSLFATLAAVSAVPVFEYETQMLSLLKRQSTSASRGVPPECTDACTDYRRAFGECGRRSVGGDEGNCHCSDQALETVVKCTACASASTNTTGQAFATSTLDAINSMCVESNANWVNTTTTAIGGAGITVSDLLGTSNPSTGSTNSSSTISNPHTDASATDTTTAAASSNTGDAVIIGTSAVGILLSLGLTTLIF